MRKILFVWAMFLALGFGIMISEVKAQTVYWYVDVSSPNPGNYVDGLAITALDYYAGLYYDPAVYAELYRTDPPFDELPFDTGYNVGFEDIFNASVYLFTNNHVVGKTYCTNGTHYVIDYYTGHRYVVKRSNICITIPPPPTPTPTPTMTPTPTPTPTPNVTSVTFTQLQPSTMPIDANPAVNSGGGLRIFPDDDVPQDPIDRRKVRVTATLSQPIPNVPVYFSNFDLDDPSPDPIIDTNGVTGNDNNGTPSAGAFSGCSATSSGCSASTDASGVATVEFTVTEQPGDNFAITASAVESEVNAVNINGIELTNGSGQNIPTTCSIELVCRSEMLTVWRRLHIEVDSMGASDGNYALGTVTNGMKIRRNQEVTFSLSPTSLLEVNRFENGRLVVGIHSFIVSSNTVDTVTATYRGPASTVTVGDNVGFTLYDDDDFNDNNGTAVNGDTGEDIPEPDTTHLTANSDDPTTNVLAPVYIRPVYDVVNSRNNSYFQANASTHTEADVRSNFIDRDLTSTNADDEFWTVYVLGAYQGSTDEDSDPATDAALLGKADGIPTTILGDGSGVIILSELHSSKEIVRFLATNPLLRSEANTVAHEVGHLLSGQHGDGGIMGEIVVIGGQLRVNIVSDQFDSTTIRRIREQLMHP